MLPPILNVAEDNSLIINPRTLNQKEIRAKCPFCYEDSNKPQKFYLSMNPELNVFKCWFCKESGGVLVFESLLTGDPLQIVREKYFGKNKKKQHFTEYLTPKQLRKIGWDEYKRNNKDDFKKKRNEVAADWNEYCCNEGRRLFALLMVSTHISDEERMNRLLQYIQDECKNSGVYLLFTMLTEEYTKDYDDRKKWAKEGTDIARAAWKATLQSGDATLENVTSYVLFMYFMFEMKKTNPKKEIKKGVIL